MYYLAVNLTISLSGRLSNIDEILSNVRDMYFINVILLPWGKQQSPKSYKHCSVLNVSSHLPLPILQQNLKNYSMTHIFIYVQFTHCPKMKMNGKVPISLSRTPRNFPNAKTRNDFFFDNWIFIWYLIQMDRTWGVRSFVPHCCIKCPQINRNIGLVLRHFRPTIFHELMTL